VIKDTGTCMDILVICPRMDEKGVSLRDGNDGTGSGWTKAA
jgi:hypothetical protein